MEEEQAIKSTDRRPSNLLKVLKVKSIQAAMDALSERCNGTGEPDFSGLMVGDYINGIDLSAIPAENEGSAGQAWDYKSKNNQIILSGFNTFKNIGDTEVTKNHILFTFKNIPLEKRINPTDDHTGGYPASELRAFLEGVNGDGTGDKAGVTTAAFLNALKGQIGDHILPVRKKVSNGVEGVWITCSLWIQTEYEVFGNVDSKVGYYGKPDHETKVHFPIYLKGKDFGQIGYKYRSKKFLGEAYVWWLGSPSVRYPTDFVFVPQEALAVTTTASKVLGCAPAFCVA